MILDREQIKGIIPHRDPFLFLDEIEELEPGKRCVAIKHVTGEEPFFEGHYPGYPVMPGVLIIEALAQTGAVCALSTDTFKGKTPLFAGIDGAKFKRQVRPGDTLRLEVEFIKVRGMIGVGKGVAYVGEEKAAMAELKFAMM